MTTKKYGPKWDTITCRVTRDMDTGDVIENHNVEWNSSKQCNKFLHRPLPEDVTDIEMALYLPQESQGNPGNAYFLFGQLHKQQHK